MARIRVSYQKGRIEQRQRRYGVVYTLRYRLRKGAEWQEKTEEIRNKNGEAFTSPKMTTDIPKEVRKAADKRMVEINKLNNNRRDEMTFEQFGKTLWRDHAAKSVKISTAYNYDSLLRTHVLPHIGKKYLSEITPADITAIRRARERSKSGAAAWSVRNLYGLLNVMFEIAVEYDLIETSPVRKRLHRPEVDTAEKPILTAGQIRKVIEAAPEEHRPMLLIVALMGLRVGELLALKWQCVDFDAHRINISQTLWQGKLLDPKTKRSRRSIHMPETIANALQIHRMRSRFTAQDDFVFSRADGMPYSAFYVRKRILTPALKKAGIRPSKSQYGFHLFRHSAASIVYGATRDLKLGQELLGHSTVRTTANIYTHTDNTAKEATELLAREIFGDCVLVVAENSERIQ